MCERIAPVRPDKCPPVIEDSDKTLTKICYDRAHEMYGEDLPKIVVDRLERVNLSSLLAGLTGRKEERLEKEEAEAVAARLQYQSAQGQLEEIRREREDCQRRIQEASDCPERYEACLQARKAALKATDTALGGQIGQLEAEIAALTARTRELQEALEAGERVQSRLEQVIRKLDSAGGWSTWDLLGGGLVSDVMKYSRLDEAQEQIDTLRGDLRRYRAELADVERLEHLDVRPGGMMQAVEIEKLKAVDIFFDNIFADWMVRDQIRRSQEEMYGLQGRIGAIQNRLREETAQTQQNLHSARDRLDRLVEEA
jgi:DNA repair exonuclease SbcCD ATPase subunit